MRWSDPVAILIRCPACEVLVRAPARYRGLRVNCPKCGDPVRVGPGPAAARARPRRLGPLAGMLATVAGLAGLLAALAYAYPPAAAGVAGTGLLLAGVRRAARASRELSETGRLPS